MSTNSSFCPIATNSVGLSTWQSTPDFEQLPGCTNRSGSHYSDIFSDRWNELERYIRQREPSERTDLTCFYHHIYDARQYVCDKSDETVHGVVHNGKYALGSLSESNDCVNYTTLEDILRSRTNPKYYCRRTSSRQEFSYRFLEYNPKDDQRTYPFLTNRTTTASAGSCYSHSVSHGDKGTKSRRGWSNYTYSNGTFSGSILLPVQVDRFDGTVYVYRGSNPPQTATIYACETRCIWMWAHKTKSPRRPSMFYQCPVSVDLVPNSRKDTHHVPDGIARPAASSIGLQGGNSDPENGWTQFQFYPIP